MAKARVIRTGLNHGVVISTNDPDKFYLVATFETPGEAAEAKRKMYKNSQGVKYHIVSRNYSPAKGKFTGWTITIGSKKRRT